MASVANFWELPAHVSGLYHMLTPFCDYPYFHFSRLDDRRSCCRVEHHIDGDRAFMNPTKTSFLSRILLLSETPDTVLRCPDGMKAFRSESGRRSLELIASAKSTELLNQVKHFSTLAEEFHWTATRIQVMAINPSGKELGVYLDSTLLEIIEALCDDSIYDVGSYVAMISEDKACPFCTWQMNSIPTN